MNNNPIGILDSGLGGLTVWKEVVSLLPRESIVYIADSQNTPYGAKSPDEIFHLAKQSIDFLLSKQVKLVVAACNAITVSCIHKLRETYPDLLIVGTVPAIKTAAGITRNNRIGILATTRTIDSDYQTALIQQFASDCIVLKHGTDKIVPLIEEGKIKSEEMTKVLEAVLLPLKEEGIDSLVLGCTHFPFLRDQMQEILGSEVTIIDSGEAIARRVKSLLEQGDLLAVNHSEPEYDFYTTGDPAIAKKLLVSTIKGKELPEFSKVIL